MQGAWKVGLLVVIFVGLLLGAYQMLGQSLFKKPTSRYDVLIADASGLAEGAKVLMAGVKVGTVSKVLLDSPTMARVVLAVDKGVKIPVGSGAAVAGSLIGFGDSPIQIVPPSKPSSRFMDPGSELVGVRLSPLADLLPDTKSTIEEVNKTLAATRKLIEDESLKKGLNDLMVSSNRTLTEFGNLASRIDGLVVSNQGTIQQAITNATAAMAEVQRTTASIQKLASDPQWKDKIAGLLDNLSSTTKKADELVTGLTAFANDPELKQALKNSVKNAEQITTSGTQIAANAAEMSKNGITITEKATVLMDKANEIADETKKLIEKFGGFINKTPGAGALGEISASMDLNRETKPNRWRTDAEVLIPYKDQRIHLGLFDSFESNRLTLQLSRPMGSNGWLRYGIYASKPGVGVDFKLAPKLFLRGDLFDINNPRADLRARYEFGKGFYGYLGVDRLLDRNAPTFGIGFRK